MRKKGQKLNVKKFDLSVFYHLWSWIPSSYACLLSENQHSPPEPDYMLGLGPWG
jgi:hypothetical protein